MNGMIVEEPGIASSDLRAELAGLHVRHYDELVRMAALLLGDVGAAEECAQEAFIKTFQSWDAIREPDKRLSYLRSVTLNGARNRRRSRARLAKRLNLGEPIIDPLDSVVLGERARRLLSEVRKLPERQRDCVLLRFYLDLSEAEIAETLGISNGTVKTHSHRGLKTLQDRLEDL